MLTTTTLSHPSFFLAVNRGCRSGMYCSSNDRSKNCVKYQGSEIINNFSLSLSLSTFLHRFVRRDFQPKKKKERIYNYGNLIFYLFIFPGGSSTYPNEGHPSLIPGNCAHAAMRWQHRLVTATEPADASVTRTCICCRTGYIFRHLR